MRVGPVQMSGGLRTVCEGQCVNTTSSGEHYGNCGLRWAHLANPLNPEKVNRLQTCDTRARREMGHPWDAFL